MQNIETQYPAGLIDSHVARRLGGKKFCAGGYVQLLLLRVGDAVADDLVPVFNHRRNLGGGIGSDRTIHEDPSFVGRMCSRVSGLNFGQQLHQRFSGLSELKLLGL